MAPRFNFLTGCFGWQPVKMSRCNTETTRSYMWILHLILIIPVAIAAFMARNNYLLVHRYPTLSQDPYNPRTEVAFFMTYIGSIILFPWLFLASLLLRRWYGTYILFYGIVNLGLAVTVAVGIGMQAKFLPVSTGGDCKDGQAASWQAVPDHPSFFTLAATLDKHDPLRAESVCKYMVQGWTVASAAAFFQFLLAYGSIFFDEREYSLLNPIRPVFWLMLLFAGPFIVLNVFILPRIRLWLSYIRKSIAEMRKTRDLKIPPQTKFVPQYESFQVPETKLQYVLTIEHVLLNVVDYLHSEDVVNLSLTCKAMREVVYPAGDLRHRVPKLLRHCCSLSDESKCTYCNNKICGSCQRNPLWPGLSGRRHVTMCKPYCEPCYYKAFAAHPRGYKKPCKCYSTDRSIEFQDVCRSCMRKEVGDLQAARHRRYQQEARDIAFNPRSKCGACRKVLKDGMRWWKCGKCSGECRDRIHPAFVKRKKGDVEKALGAGDAEGEVSWWRKWRNIL